MPTLVKVETDTWQLEVVGNLPQMPPFLPFPSTAIYLEGSAQVLAFNRATSRLLPIQPGSLVEPLFFENTAYDFYLQSSDESITLNLPPTATSRHRLKDLTHYSLNFRNDVGFFDITIRSAKQVTRVRFEVFPRKIDYRTDYLQMRDEVAAITRNLVMTVQARTFGLAIPSPTATPTILEWLTLIRHYFNELVKTAEAIVRSPHSTLESKTAMKSVDQAKKVGERELNRIMRGKVSRAGGMLPGKRIPLPTRVPEVQRKKTYDTPVNQYFKAVLKDTLHNLKRIARTDTTGDEDSDLTAEQKFFGVARVEATAMMQRLRRILAAPFLRAVSATPTIRPTSLVLDRHPHYATFARIARLLNGGLTASHGLLQIGIKDIALLYEYWCFLKLIQLLREQMHLEQQNLVQVKHLKVTVVLIKGKESKVVFKEPISGRKVVVIYNRLFNDLPTVAQRPDNIIQLARENELYIFDAKYRLAYDNDYLRKHGGPGPLVDDINTMHRYRDAIVSSSPLSIGVYTRGIVKQAIVLFPFRDNSSQYASHRFYTSIRNVQIGGLPFLPGSTHLVADHVRGLLNQVIAQIS